LTVNFVIIRVNDVYVAGQLPRATRVENVSSGHLPATDKHINETIGSANELLAFAERQFPDARNR
jgi:hypothetical protein